MTVMTKKRSAFLDQLVAVAGDSTVVEEALRTLNEESAAPPIMREIVRRILESRQRRRELAHAV